MLKNIYQKQCEALATFFFFIHPSILLNMSHFVDVDSFET